MLEELIVRNYALIADLRIEFSRGLNILTGETGAGKSILIGSLGLLLGLRSDISMIRTGAESTLVSGVIRVGDNPEVVDWLRERGIDPEGERVILRRTVKRSGRGTVHLQSTPITLRDMSSLTALLFDMHGQHDHQSLLSTHNQRRILDRYGGIEPEVARFTKEFERHSDLIAKLETFRRNERERLQEMDFLRYAVREIEEANLAEGEDDSLEQELQLLENSEQLFSLLDEVHAQTAENRGGSCAMTRKAVSALTEASRVDGRLSSLKDQLEESHYVVEDIAESVRRHRESITFSPERIESINARLSEIGTLKKKYGNSIDDILTHLNGCAAKLERLEHWEEEVENVEADVGESKKRLKETADSISKRRTSSALKLQEAVERELHRLGMSKVKFRVLVYDRKREEGGSVYNQYGKDGIEFQLTANPGEPAKSLRAIASGGEMSRVMLALKSVLSASDRIESLIFDEIDAGIGGQVALAVGERLRNLSRSKQVLCITHLATIAVRADNHIKVEKDTVDDRTVTIARQVRGPNRVEEIARMLAGDEHARASLSHAEELLRTYGITEGR